MLKVRKDHSKCTHSQITLTHDECEALFQYKLACNSGSKAEQELAAENVQAVLKGNEPPHKIGIYATERDEK